MSAKTIQEINDKYDYEDTNPGGARDKPLVSCAQCGDYNELQHIFDKKLAPFITKGAFTKQQAITALEDACADLKNPRSRTDFYKKLSSLLGVVIE